MYSDERAMLPPTNSEISFGRIGTMIPNASMSRRTVTKTNPSAACRLLFIGILLARRNGIQGVQPKFYRPIYAQAVSRRTIVQQEPTKTGQNHGRARPRIRLRIAPSHQGQGQESQPVFYCRSQVFSERFRLPQRHDVNLQRHPEKPLVLRGTHVLPDRPARLPWRFIGKLLHPLVGYALLLPHSGQRSHHQFLFGPKVVKQNPWTRPHGLGQRPQRQFRHPVLCHMLHDRIHQLGRSFKVSCSRHAWDTIILETIVSSMMMRKRPPTFSDTNPDCLVWLTSQWRHVTTDGEKPTRATNWPQRALA